MAEIALKIEEVALLLAKAAGGRPSIVNVSLEHGSSTEAEKGRVARVERWSEGWVSLEIEDGSGRVGFASATLGAGGFDPEALVGSALSSALVLQPDSARRISNLGRAKATEVADIFDSSWSANETDGGELAVRLEAAALSADERIRSARKPTFEAEISTRLVMVCGEVSASWRETSFGLHVEVAAEGGGGREAGWAACDSRRYGGLDPEAVGVEAARRAASLLGAKRAPVGVFPALIDRRVAAEMLEVVAPSFLADSHRKKTSLFTFEAGKQAFSPLINIVDDGSLKSGPTSQPVDDEGAPSRRTVCVDRGRLSALLYDRAEGARDGIGSTGNGSGGPEGPCAPDTTNFFILAGDQTTPSLLALIGRGLYVTEVMGMHTADPITGDFSVGCSGLWIEGGTVAYPITQAAISGNLLELFAGVDGVGDDFRFSGAFGSSTLLVPNLDLAG